MRAGAEYRMMFFSCASSSSCSCSCSCCSCTTSYFRIFVGPKNRHVHLIQRLSCKITNATEFASTGASSAERMALRSVNPAGWNCSIARDRMLSAVIYLEAINSSLSDSGRALRSSDEARLSSLDHFFC